MQDQFFIIRLHTMAWMANSRLCSLPVFIEGLLLISWNVQITKEPAQMSESGVFNYIFSSLMCLAKKSKLVRLVNQNRNVLLKLRLWAELLMPVLLIFGENANLTIPFFLLSTPVRFLLCVPLHYLLADLDEFLNKYVIKHAPKPIKRQYRDLRLKIIEYRNYME